MSRCLVAIASVCRHAIEHLDESPIGAAALAGTGFAIDRHMTAEALGFSGGPTRNSIDTVSDRDFALEFLSTASICATHLSRLAEEIVIWSTPQFNFVRLSDSFSTGSSIMPQKKNPDAAELVRAKTGRVNGALIALLTVMKGLPLAYSKDMQEDKEQVFDAAKSLELAIAAMTGMVGDLTVNVTAMKAAAGSGFSTATDLADWLVREAGLPFRDAHHATGHAVALAEKKGCDLSGLSLAELQEINPAITAGIFDVPDRGSFRCLAQEFRWHGARRGQKADRILAQSDLRDQKQGAQAFPYRLSEMTIMLTDCALVGQL